MKLAPSLAALVRGAAFLNTLCDLLPRVYAADQHPSHTVTYFENLPQRLYYFDDTTVSNQSQHVQRSYWPYAMADSGMTT
jgi:hypothetical protein